MCNLLVSFLNLIRLLRPTSHFCIVIMHPSYPEERRKLGWIEEHDKLVAEAHKPADILLIGDSIIFNFKKYPNVWKKNFTNLKNVNYGIRGDCTQHVLWRIKFGLLPLAGLVLIHAGTNNLKKCGAWEIAKGIVKIATAIHDRMPNARLVITGLLPRNGRNSFFRKEADSVNNHIEDCLKDLPILFLKPGEHWTLANGNLNPDFYYTDELHLIEGGYNYFCQCIKRLIFSAPLPSTVVSSSLPTSVVSSSLPAVVMSFSLPTSVVSSSLPTSVVSSSLPAVVVSSSLPISVVSSSLPTSVVSSSLPHVVMSSSLPTSVVSSSLPTSVVSSSLPHVVVSSSLPTSVVSSSLPTSVVSSSLPHVVMSSSLPLVISSSLPTSVVSSSLPTSVVSPSLFVSSLLVTCSVSKPVRRKVLRHHKRAPASLPPLKFVDFRFFDKLIS
jgi:hypothetical protein